MLSVTPRALPYKKERVFARECARYRELWGGKALFPHGVVRSVSCPSFSGPAFYFILSLRLFTQTFGIFTFLVLVPLCWSLRALNTARPLSAQSSRWDKQTRVQIKPSRPKGRTWVLCEHREGGHWLSQSGLL